MRVASGLGSSVRRKLWPDMGRWAQAVRRGCQQVAPVELGPPTAPILTQPGGSLTWNPTCTLDAGAMASIYWSDYEVGPWEFYDSLPAANPVVWGVLPELSGRYLVGTHTGGGELYVGESAYSAPIYYV